MLLDELSHLPHQAFVGQVGLNRHLSHGELVKAAARAVHHSPLQGPVETPGDTSPGGELLQAGGMDQLVAALGHHKGRRDDIFHADHAFHGVFQVIHGFVTFKVFSLKYSANMILILSLQLIYTCIYS